MIGGTTGHGNVFIGRGAHSGGPVHRTTIAKSAAVSSAIECSVVVDHAEWSPENGIQDVVSARHVVEHLEKSDDCPRRPEKLEGRNAEPASREGVWSDTPVLDDAAVFEGAPDEGVAVDKNAFPRGEGNIAIIHIDSAFAGPSDALISESIR